VPLAIADVGFVSDWRWGASGNYPCRPLVIIIVIIRIIGGVGRIWRIVGVWIIRVSVSVPIGVVVVSGPIAETERESVPAKKAATEAAEAASPKPATAYESASSSDESTRESTAAAKSATKATAAEAVSSAAETTAPAATAETSSASASSMTTTALREADSGQRKSQKQNMKLAHKHLLLLKLLTYVLAYPSHRTQSAVKMLNS
jgi:hypothetical protein